MSAIIVLFSCAVCKEASKRPPGLFLVLVEHLHRVMNLENCINLTGTCAKQTCRVYCEAY